jgi:hypothetical protein
MNHSEQPSQQSKLWFDSKTGSFAIALGNLKRVQINMQYSCIYTFMVTTEINGNGTKNGNSLPPYRIAQPTEATSLSQADRDIILNLITQIREMLPFLEDLTAEERRTMAGMGTQNRAFAGKVLEVIDQNADFLPRSFDIQQLRSDLETFDRLSTLVMALTQMSNLTDATAIAIGTRAYEQALVAYRHAKASGQGASMDDMMEGMKQRFTKKSKKKKATQPAEMPVVETPLEPQ